MVSNNPQWKLNLFLAKQGQIVHRSEVIDKNAKNCNKISKLVFSVTYKLQIDVSYRNKTSKQIFLVSYTLF